MTKVERTQRAGRERPTAPLLQPMLFVLSLHVIAVSSSSSTTTAQSSALRSQTHLCRRSSVDAALGAGVRGLREPDVHRRLGRQVDQDWGCNRALIREMSESEVRALQNRLYPCAVARKRSRMAFTDGVLDQHRRRSPMVIRWRRHRPRSSSFTRTALAGWPDPMVQQAGTQGAPACQR